MIKRRQKLHLLAQKTLLLPHQGEGDNMSSPCQTYQMKRPKLLANLKQIFECTFFNELVQL